MEKITDLLPTSEVLKEKNKSSTNLQTLSESGSLEIAGKNYSPIEFGTVFNQDYPVKVAERGLTIIQAVSGSTPTLGKVSHILGYKTAKATVKNWIDRLNDFYGKGSLSPVQIDEVSALIVSEYYYLKMSELAIFFNRFKLGKYGEFYGAIDPLRIMSGLLEFISERRSEIEEYEKKERIEFNEKKVEEETRLRNELFIQERWVMTLLELVNKIKLTQN